MTRSKETSPVVSLTLRQAIAMVLLSSAMSGVTAFDAVAQEATTDTSSTATDSTAKKDEGDVANLSDVNVSADAL